MTKNNMRWKTAIHEAGHCITAIILGGQCHRLAIHHTGGGIAFVTGLSPFDHAVMVAAASEAETLLADSPPPEREPSPESFDVPDPISELTATEKLEHIAAKHPVNKSPTDEHCIAQFCIRGLESEPERWAQRYHLIHHIAAQVVRDHRDAILRVATELFTRGVLSEFEIKEAIKCP